MLGYIILIISISCYVLKRLKVDTRVVNALRFFNLGLCAVMIILNPWLLPILLIMLGVMYVYLRKKGLPKKIGLWA